jgi:hypothetical protein
MRCNFGRPARAPDFLPGRRSDDQKGNNGKPCRNTRGSRKHLATMAARPIDARRAACRNQRSIEFGGIGIGAGQRCTGALGIGFKLEHVSSAPAVNR